MLQQINAKALFVKKFSRFNEFLHIFMSMGIFHPVSSKIWASTLFAFLILSYKAYPEKVQTNAYAIAEINYVIEICSDFMLF